MSRPVQIDYRSKKALRAALLSLAVTTIVVAIKIVAAWLSGSVGVLAEALQSTLDVLMSGLAVMAVRVAAAPPDASHPYGHGKIEQLFSTVQLLLVIGISFWIVYQAVQRLADPVAIEAGIGMVGMAVPIAINLGMIAYLRRVAEDTNSTALRGEIEHLRSDMLATGGVLLGLILYWATGLYAIDPITAILFTLLAAYHAARQLNRVVHPLVGGALPPEEVKKIVKVAMSHPEARGVHGVKSQSTGQIKIVVFHLLLDDDLPFVRAHALAEEIEDEVSAALGGAHVTIHYEPYLEEHEHHERVPHGNLSAPTSVEVDEEEPKEDR
ncbi:MAG: cation diffusion facilitator family transporter [Fimbriimonadaceae bacterium]